MTAPRMIVPQKTYLITRRTIQRTFLFAPDPVMNQIYLYALAVAAQRFEVLVHLPELMSDHEHLVATDTKGNVPNFARSLHRWVALSTKAYRGWDGAVWDGRKPSFVALETAQAQIEAIGYAIANPVTAGLVRRSSDWPGVTMRADQLGKLTWTIARPQHWFAANDDVWPPVVELRSTLPPAAAELGEDVFRDLVAEDVKQREEAARQDLKDKGWAFFGLDRCRRISPFDTARSVERPRSGNPTFAVGRRRRAARKAGAAQRRGFHHAYQAAMLLWCSGKRDVVFPYGTWLMRELHRASIADPPAPLIALAS